MRLQTVCGRVHELKRMGLVWEGKETRDGRRVVHVAKRHSNLERKPCAKTKKET